MSALSSRASVCGDAGSNKRPLWFTALLLRAPDADDDVHCSFSMAEANGPGLHHDTFSKEFTPNTRVGERKFQGGGPS